MELVILSVLTIISFFAVQGSDPGYLSRDVMERACAMFDSSIHCTESRSRLSLLGDVGVAEMEIELSPSSGAIEGEYEGLVLHTSSIDTGASKSMLRLYCPRCKFAPPLRAHHCKHCDVCVSTYDHHCHFIGTCIGERNHCRFWWFLTFQMLSFFVMISIVNSKKNPLGLDGTDTDEIPGFVMVVFSSIFIWPLAFFAFMVWASHTYFALTNTTSFEFVKVQHLEYLHGTNECDMPFSKGVDENLRNFCCLRDTTWAIFTGENFTRWLPTMWDPPGIINRNSEDWFENPWQNKYYSCC